MIASTDADMMQADLLEQVAQIVSAYVSNNAVSILDVPALIASTHLALRSLSEAPIAEPVQALVPAVPIKKSVTPEFIVCLDDGKKFKSLKRHLTGLGMTPNEYRAKWGLHSDYPMVAPQYAATRTALAKSYGLGRKATVPLVSAKRDKEPKVAA